MSADGFKYVYGPVPSRRLGKSLGIDLVPYKTCTYDCVYCQLGKTGNLTVKRREFVPTEELISELRRKLSYGSVPNYISLAGSGEPTLHSAIGPLISGIRQDTDIPIAVLTNGSLLWMREVQDALLHADIVIPSLDAGDERLFRYVNHPHKSVTLKRMVNGIAEFTRRFSGQIWLEIMLIKGITDTAAEAKKIAALVEYIKPARVQLNTVSRPPARKSARPIPGDTMAALRSFFPEPVDIICTPSGSSKQTVPLSPVREEDILALVGRRPCTADDIAKGLGVHVAEAIKLLSGLVEAGEVRAVTVDGHIFHTSPAQTLKSE